MSEFDSRADLHDLTATAMGVLTRRRDVSSITKAPEMLGGRVKTLHPAVHGGESMFTDDKCSIQEIR